MLVKNWMSKPAITVNADAVLSDAINLFHKHEIHTLPVIEGTRLVGIFSDQDLKRATVPDCASLNFPNELDHRLQKAVSKIMTVNPVTICDNQTIEDAAELLLVHKISGLPVINQAREVVGMITKSNLFWLILSTIGMGKDGIQIAFELVDRPGCIKEVTDIIRAYGGRIGTVFSTRERAKRGYRQTYIRIYNIDLPSLARLKEVLREEVKMLYIVNHRDKICEIL